MCSSDLGMYKDYLQLYGITDKGSIEDRTLIEEVEKAIKGGITCLQYREKHLSKEAQLEEAKALRVLTRRYDIPFIINDNVDLALLCEADGVHLGQQDDSIQEARRKLGPNKLIGATAKTVGQAKQAEEAGADYIGSGAVFGSNTKLDASYLSYESLKEIGRASCRERVYGLV